MPRFEVTTSSAGNQSWRLIADNGQTIATAGETFATASNAKRAATSFKSNVDAHTLEVYADASGGHRWRAKAGNGQTVASSGEAFASQANAQHAADNVKSVAGGATGP